MPIVEKAKDKYDLILIDTASYDSRMATYVINVADTCIILINSAEDDIRTAISVTKHIEILNIGKTDPIQSVCVLWKTDKGTSVTKHARDQLEGLGITIFTRRV